MPTVPRYQQQVREQGLSNERLQAPATAESFGAGSSFTQAQNAAQGLLGEVVKVQKEETQKANELRLLEMRRKLNDWELSKIYDPNNGAITKKGKDAFGLPEELGSSYDKFIQENEKDLANDDQRLAFKQLAGARREAINRWTSDHVLKQTELVEEQEFNSALESSKERGSIDPNNAPLEAAFVRDQAVKRAQQLGLGPKMTRQFVQGHESDLHQRVVNQLIAKNQDLAAKNYFESVKDLMDPDVAEKLMKPLEDVSLRGESQRITLQLTKQYPLENIKEALGQVDKMTKDPKLQDAVRQRLWDRYEEQVKADKVAKEVNFEKVINTLYQDRRRDAITPQQWETLTPTQKKAAESVLKNETTATDWRKYTDLIMMASEPATRQKFLETHPAEYLPFLAPNEYKEILKTWTEARNGNTKGMDGFLSDQNLIDGRLAQQGIDPREAPTSVKGKLRQAVSEAVNRQVIEYKRDNKGKKPSPEDIQKWTDFQTMQVVTEGFLWNSTKRVVDLTPEDKIVGLDIPKDEVDRIVQALQAKGKPVTQKNVFELYIKARKK